MNRRTMLAALASLPAALGAVVTGRRLYGEMDVERWTRLGFRGKKRVLCDGKDITMDCYWFDDRIGAADVIRKDAEGNYFPERYGVAKQRIYGRIEVFDEPA